MEAGTNRPGFRFPVKGSGIQWTTYPDRLLLETESSHEDCGAPLAIVLGYLKWTPLRGIGTNLEFEAEAAIADQIRCKLPQCEEIDGYSTNQRTWHIGLRRGQQIFNMQVSCQYGQGVPTMPRQHLP